MACANSTAITKGDALEDNGSGYLALATATSNNVPFVAMQTVTTTSAGQKVLCIATKGVIFLADTAATWTQTQVGTLVDLSTEKLLDSATTDSKDLFEIIEGVGAAADKKVKGKFRMQLNA